MAATSNALGGQAASTSFISRLPDDVIKNILRLCSAKPNRSDWPAHLAPGDLCCLLEAMPGAVKATFDGLCVGKKSKEFVHPQQKACQYLNSEQASTAFFKYHFPDLQVLLERVESLEYFPSYSIAERDAVAVADHGDALRSLRCYSCQYSEPLSKILHARGHQLRTLDACFASQKMSRVIAERCTGLRELRMFSHKDSLDIILPAVGAQLVKLHIRAAISVEDHFHVIRNHCSALETIILRSMRSCERAHAQLLASYAGQLRFADLNALELVNVTLVATSCVNAKFQIYTDSSQVLDVLGSAADVVELSFASAKPLDIRNGFKKCIAIRNLMLCGFEEVDDDVLELSLSSPVPGFPVLESFIVGPEAELRRKEMELFSTCTGYLHWLELAVNCYDTEAILGLNALVRANPRLSFVKVHIVDLTAEPTPEEDEGTPMEVDYFPQVGSDFDGELDYEDAGEVFQVASDESSSLYLVPDGDGEWAICEMLRILTKCANVREIVLDAETRSDESWDELVAVWDLWASSFRLRRVHLRVLGVCYAPQ